MSTKSIAIARYGRLALCALLLPGCYTTSVSSGRPAAKASIEYDEKWHHGLVWGIAELSGPYNLEKVCPDGWSEITTETSFLNGLAEAVTNGIYAPQNITVRCAVPAKPPAAAAPAAAGPVAPSAAPGAISPPTPVVPSEPAEPAPSKLTPRP